MNLAGRRPRGVEKKLFRNVVTAGMWVKANRNTIAGSNSSQPWIQSRFKAMPRFMV